MRKYITTLLLAAINQFSFAQNSSILVRHDTLLLKAVECEWIVKSLEKNDPSLTGQIGKTFPQILIESIASGKLKAIDPETNKQIPSKEIRTWNMRIDSVMVYDEKTGDVKMMVVKRELDPESITQIRVFQDWYMDVASGNFRSEIKWIELLREVISSSGIMLGYAPFCRIYY